MTPLIYAIDFGTSNSLLAAGDAQQVYEAIPLDPVSADPSILRSLLYFPSMEKVFYGKEAVMQYTERAGQGRLLRSLKKHLPVRSFIGTWIEERPVNLEDLIGFFLAEMRRRANAHFQQDVTRVVMGRPARFSTDDATDQFAQFRLERAAKLAGFTEVEFCAEPIAAAYDFRTTLQEPKIVLVADFGGGTSDYTIVRLRRESFSRADVLALGGVSLAGDALDGTLMRHKLTPYFGSGIRYKVPFGLNELQMPVHLMEKLCSPADMALLQQKDTREFLRHLSQVKLSKKDATALQRLTILVDDQQGFSVFESIERAKRNLSEVAETRLQYEYPGLTLDEPLHRQEFETFSADVVTRVLDSLDETLKQAGLSADKIDLVCCTGGTAKVPAIQKGIEARFGKDKIQTRLRFHSVVQGLAQRASALARGE